MINLPKLKRVLTFQLLKSDFIHFIFRFAQNKVARGAKCNWGKNFSENIIQSLIVVYGESVYMMIVMHIVFDIALEFTFEMSR